MTIFFKETTSPREVDNIYKEFENLFSESIRMVESEWDDEKHSMVDHTLEYIIENLLFESHYEFLINEIKKHTLEQISKYNTIQIISFFEKQRINDKLFSPEKRKRNLFEDYLVMNVGWGDDSILKKKYQLTNYQKSFIKHAYEKYSTAYYLLVSEMEDIFSSFLIVLQTTVNQEKLTTGTKQPGKEDLEATLTETQIFSPIVDETHKAITRLKEEEQTKVYEHSTCPVIALFCYYLIQYEKVDKPTKEGFPKFAERYHFTVKSTHPYNLFLKLYYPKPLERTTIKTLNNLKAVVKLLEPYTNALRAAEEALYLFEHPKK